MADTIPNAELCYRNDYGHVHPDITHAELACPLCTLHAEASDAAEEVSDDLIAGPEGYADDVTFTLRKIRDLLSTLVDLDSDDFEDVVFQLDSADDDIANVKRTIENAQESLKNFMG